MSTTHSMECQPVPAGTVMVHDYRIFHRGTANRSSHARPLLYMTFGSQEFEEMDPNLYLGSAFGRIDQEAWDAVSPQTQSVLKKWKVTADRAPDGLAGSCDPALSVRLMGL
eukprot:TRINITY_DN14264_c0_g1_i1.p1 TRINITY_DN14264_c0_g1~~TRINITY_DN14264_c0_g1_i1.p1  ORF type:complete len:111 (-),score=11.08 TRINITY_DN14264_c0_g1_i1:266-598(-)